MEKIGSAEKMELLIDQFINSCTNKKMTIVLTELIQSSWDAKKMINFKSKNEIKEVTEN